MTDNDYALKVFEVFRIMCGHRRKIQSPFTVAGDESAFDKALLWKLGHLKVEVLARVKDDVLDWIDTFNIHKDDRRHLKRIICRIIEYQAYLHGGPVPKYRTGTIKMGRWENIVNVKFKVKEEVDG
jgi:hypothetical protein